MAEWQGWGDRGWAQEELEAQREGVEASARPCPAKEAGGGAGSGCSSSRARRGSTGDHPPRLPAPQREAGPPRVRAPPPLLVLGVWTAPHTHWLHKHILTTHPMPGLLWVQGLPRQPASLVAPSPACSEPAGTPPRSKAPARCMAWPGGRPSPPCPTSPTELLVVVLP